MDVIESTRGYERWLQSRLTVVARDIELKHRRMREDVFFFLRASFYRWAQVWPSVCADLVAAPRVLGVGDLHIENFGTWRDGEGRLVWGINDFDEATRLPYTIDLVRLCTSALFAIDASHLGTSSRLACDAVLEGYTAALQREGGAVVLAERHRWLRDIAVSRLAEQRAFWNRLLAHKSVSTPVPARVRRLLREAMPERRLAFRIVHRQAGLGSLGRQRFTALAEWRGGTIARETKPLTASAWAWAMGSARAKLEYGNILGRAVRVPDPFLALHGDWVVRRLAPDCSRIELAAMRNVRDACRLLWMMGWETGNVHLGTDRERTAILKDLRAREGRWLLSAARAMRKATTKDWRVWRAGSPRK